MHKAPVKSHLHIMSYSSVISTYYTFVKNSISQNESSKWVSSCSNKTQNEAAAPCLSLCRSHSVLIKCAARVCRGIKYKLHYHSRFRCRSHTNNQRRVRDMGWERLFIILGSALRFMFSVTTNILLTIENHIH